MEERTVEEKRPREGRLARYFEAPLLPAASGFESEGGAEEPAMAPGKKKKKQEEMEVKIITFTRLVGHGPRFRHIRTWIMEWR